MKLTQATEQATNTPIADFTIGACLFLAAFIIVCLFTDKPVEKGSK